jgi:hypothetical protein
VPGCKRPWPIMKPFDDDLITAIRYNTSIGWEVMVPSFPPTYKGHPVAPLDCEKIASYTLQYLGCFPSGRLEIVPSSEEWKGGKGPSSDAVLGSARGLGAAPKEAL